jgi:hypothetical protein
MIDCSESFNPFQDVVFDGNSEQKEGRIAMPNQQVDPIIDEIGETRGGLRNLRRSFGDWFRLLLLLLPLPEIGSLRVL